MDRAFERQFERRRGMDARGDLAGRCAIEKIARLEVRQEALDIGESVARRLAVLIPEGDLRAGAGETDRPSAADEA